MSGIKNLIFDLGGLLIRLDFNRTISLFHQLFSKDLSLLDKYYKEGFFEQYEVGAISEAEFLNTLKGIDETITDIEIINAWNAMLLDIPTDGIQLLRELKAEGYNLSLLSNTNTLHLSCILDKLRMLHGLNDFNKLFDQLYYSHEIHLRKPNVEIYEYVLHELKASPNQAVFFDDSEENINAAAQMGIHAFLHPQNGSLRETVQQMKTQMDILDQMGQ